MRKDKVRAYKLRRDGKSYKYIQKALGIPLGTIAGWFKDEDWSQKIRDDLKERASTAFPAKLAAIVKANKKRWSRIYDEYRQVGEKEFETLKDNPLFLAGVMLYWGQGEKNPKMSRLKLSNPDPLLIRTFYLFLKDVLKIPKDKILFWLTLYPDLNDNMQKTFWSRATGIPLSQFKESVYIKGQRPIKRSSYGVCNIYIQSRELKEKMMAWINLYQKILA